MRSIAASAGVSLKTVEALFATKPALLEATLLATLSDDAASSDTSDVYQPDGMLKVQAEAARRIAAAPDAASMLQLRAAVVCYVE